MKISPAIRFTAFLTGVIFSINALSGPSLGRASVAQSPAAEVSQKFPPLKTIEVPPQLGKIDEVFRGNSGKTVILVQDAHSIPEAQRNIQKLIQHFIEKYGIRKVGLEGAGSRLDPQIFHGFPDRELLGKTLGSYFERGELPGGVAAAILSQSSEHVLFQGIEDWPLYEQGLALYLAAMGKEEKLLRKLESESRSLEKEKAKEYSKTLLEIDQALQSFAEHHAGLPEVLRKLAAVLRPAKGSSVEMILEELESDKGRWGKDDKKREEKYSQLGSRFSEEFEAYEKLVKESLFRSAEERRLDRQGRKLYLLKKLAGLELSRKEWEEIKKETGVTRPLSPHLAFYQNAEKRDRVFLQNLIKLMNNSNEALMVSGGFHAQGIAEQLRRQNISYAVVVPQISSVPENSSYRDQMTGNVSWKNYFKVENGRINLYESFVRALRDKLLSDKSRVMGDASLLKRWRDQIIRSLAEKEQISKAYEYTRFLDEKSDSHFFKGQAENIPVWRREVQKFITGLHGLQSNGQLNQQSILNILKPSTIQPRFSISLAPGDSVSVLPRSEVRSAAAIDEDALAMEFEGLFNPVRLEHRLNALWQEEKKLGVTVDEKFSASDRSVFYASADQESEKGHLYKIARYEEVDFDLLNEARKLLKLKGFPGIPVLRGIGLMSNGRLWLKLEGLPEAKDFKRYPFSNPGELLEALLQAGQILHSAHGHRLLHNDVKHENFLKNDRQVQMIDLEYASDLPAKVFAGTLAYLPADQSGYPERNRAIDTDVFAFIQSISYLLKNVEAAKPIESLRNRYLELIFKNPAEQDLHPFRSFPDVHYFNLQKPRDEWPKSMDIVLRMLREDLEKVRSEVRSNVVENELLEYFGGYEGLEGKRGVELGPKEDLNLINRLRSRGVLIEGVGAEFSSKEPYLHSVADYDDYFMPDYPAESLDFIVGGASIYFEHAQYAGRLALEQSADSPQILSFPDQKRQQRIRMRYGNLVRALKPGGLLVTTHYKDRSDEENLLTENEMSAIGLAPVKRYLVRYPIEKYGQIVAHVPRIVTVMKKPGVSTPEPLRLARSEARQTPADLAVRKHGAFARSEVREANGKIYTRLLDIEHEGLIPLAIRYLDLFIKLQEEDSVHVEDGTGSRVIDLTVLEGKRVYFSADGKENRFVLGELEEMPGFYAQEDAHPVVLEWDAEIKNISAVYIALDKDETEYAKFEILSKKPKRGLAPFDASQEIFDEGLRPIRLILGSSQELVLRSGFAQGPLRRSEARTGKKEREVFDAANREEFIEALNEIRDFYGRIDLIWFPEISQSVPFKDKKFFDNPGNYFWEKLVDGPLLADIKAWLAGHLPVILEVQKRKREIVIVVRGKPRPAWPRKLKVWVNGAFAVGAILILAFLAKTAYQLWEKSNEPAPIPEIKDVEPKAPPKRSESRSNEMPAENEIKRQLFEKSLFKFERTFQEIMNSGSKEKISGYLKVLQTIANHSLFSLRDEKPALVSSENAGRIVGLMDRHEEDDSFLKANGLNREWRYLIETFKAISLFDAPIEDLIKGFLAAGPERFSVEYENELIRQRDKTVQFIASQRQWLTAEMAEMTASKKQQAAAALGMVVGLIMTHVEKSRTLKKSEALSMTIKGLRAIRTLMDIFDGASDRDFSTNLYDSLTSQYNLIVLLREKISARSEKRMLMRFLNEQAAHDLGNEVIKKIANKQALQNKLWPVFLRHPLSDLLVASREKQAGQYRYGDQVFTHERGRLFGVRDTGFAVHVERIGPLIFVVLNFDDFKNRKAIVPGIEVMKKKLGDLYLQNKENIIFTVAPYYSSPEFNHWVIKPIVAMLANAKEFQGAVVTDFGSGNALLSRIARVLGAKHVFLIERSLTGERENPIGEAKAYLEADQWKAGSYHLIEAELTNPQIERKYQEYGVRSRTEIGILNMGPHPQYGDTNQVVMRQIAKWKPLRLIINGGYSLGDLRAESHRDIFEEMVQLLHEHGWNTVTPELSTHARGYGSFIVGMRPSRSEMRADSALFKKVTIDLKYLNESYFLVTHAYLRRFLKDPGIEEVILKEMSLSREEVVSLEGELRALADSHHRRAGRLIVTAQTQDGKSKTHDFALKRTLFIPNRGMTLSQIEEGKALSDRYGAHPFFQAHYARVLDFRHYSISSDLKNKLPTHTFEPLPETVAFEINEWAKGRQLKEVLAEMLKEPDRKREAEALVERVVRAYVRGWKEFEGEILYDAGLPDILIEDDLRGIHFIDMNGRGSPLDLTPLRYLLKELRDLSRDWIDRDAFFSWITDEKKRPSPYLQTAAELFVKLKIRKEDLTPEETGLLGASVYAVLTRTNLEEFGRDFTEETEKAVSSEAETYAAKTKSAMQALIKVFLAEMPDTGVAVAVHVSKQNQDALYHKEALQKLAGFLDSLIVAGGIDAEFQKVFTEAGLQSKLRPEKMLERVKLVNQTVLPLILGKKPAGQVFKQAILPVAIQSGDYNEDDWSHYDARLAVLLEYLTAISAALRLSEQDLKVLQGEPLKQQADEIRAKAMGWLYNFDAGLAAGVQFNGGGASIMMTHIRRFILAARAEVRIQQAA